LSRAVKYFFFGVVLAGSSTYPQGLISYQVHHNKMCAVTTYMSQTKRSTKCLFEVFCFNPVSTLPNLSRGLNPKSARVSLESGLSFMQALLDKNDPQCGEKYLSCGLSWSQIKGWGGCLLCKSCTKTHCSKWNQG